MKKLLITSLLVIIAQSLFSQDTLTIDGQTKIDTVNCDVGYGIQFPKTVPIIFTFKNNYVRMCNINGYMLEAGYETPTTYTNNLQGAQIIGNMFKWTGNQDANTITHGIFTGYNTDVRIMYNYLDHVPMSIIRKSNGMTDTSGVVAYNIIKSPTAVGLVVKGMNGVRIYNNTFYSEDSTYVGPGIGTWRGLIDIYTNTDASAGNDTAYSKNVKIKNNIFYTKKQLTNIKVYETENLEGFECDYNIYWCESGEPMFDVGGVRKTLTQWREMGYDTHSQLINPYFIDTENFVPFYRMQWGTPTEFDMGIAASDYWFTGADMVLVQQDGYWQQGARVYEGDMVIFYHKGRFTQGDSISVELNTGKVVIKQGEVYIQQ